MLYGRPGMETQRYKELLRPLWIGPVELPCRIVSTAHQTTLVADHLPSDDFVAYHAARARGGAGLIVLEATAVAPSGLLTGHTLGGYLPDIAAGYLRVGDPERSLPRRAARASNRRDRAARGRLRHGRPPGGRRRARRHRGERRPRLPARAVLRSVPQPAQRPLRRADAAAAPGAGGCPRRRYGAG